MGKNYVSPQSIFFVKFILVTSILFMVIGNTYGVDTDMSSYPAPYLMVDPETGQLIEVDPSKDSNTNMENSGNSQITTQENLEQAETKEPSFKVYYLAVALLVGLIIFYVLTVKKYGAQKTSV